MSIIKQLFKEYSQAHISYAMVGQDPSIATVNILNRLLEELRKREWKFSPTEVPTDSIAMSAFLEMFTLKIGKDNPIMLCYYYSSRVANDKSCPEHVRALGNMFRAFIVFKAMDKLNMAFNLACNAPFAGYRGKLNNQQFFDMSLLCDIYKAWDLNNDDPLLQNLKRQAPRVAANYPTFSRVQIIKEGEMAHEALLKVICSFLKIRE